MRNIFCSFLIFIIATSSSQAQVTIRPEIGLSYSSYTVSPNVIFAESSESDRVDILFGLSGTVPFTEQWNINMRLSYIQREDVAWSGFVGIVGAFTKYEYAHDDFNVDLNTTYELFNSVRLGVGISYVRSINAMISYQIINHHNFPEGNRSGTKQITQSNFGAHAVCSIDLKKVILKLKYTHLLFGNSSDHITLTDYGNSFQMIFSVPLFDSKNGVGIR